MARRLRIAVLCGGPSNEREVSLRSGQKIFAALDRKRYAPRILALPKDTKKIPGILIAARPRIDLALIALHGTFGEDGTIQGILDALRIPYTGSGMVASALGMDKNISLVLAARGGLRTPRSFLAMRTDDTRLGNLIARHIGRYPLVVKPNASGSSVGVSIVHTKTETARAFRAALRHDTRVLIQEYIAGRELTCGVLGNDGGAVRALPPVEIVSATEFFDYEAKYTSPDTKELCPAPIPASVRRELMAAAVRAHVLHGCDGLTRSDFILDRKGRLFFLEINTIPGMTEASLCPKEARALGWSFGQFLDRIIALARTRHRI